MSHAAERANCGQDEFLVVMQVRDDRPEVAPLAVTKLSGPGYVGFRVADQVVLFPGADVPLGSAINVELPGGGPVDVIVAGVAPGLWSASGASPARRPMMAI